MKPCWMCGCQNWKWDTKGREWLCRFCFWTYRADPPRWREPVQISYRRMFDLIGAMGALLLVLSSGCAAYRPIHTVDLVGDCDHDGRVDATEWSTCWQIEQGGRSAAPLRICAPCDSDGDGIVTAGEAGWATWNGGVR